MCINIYSSQKSIHSEDIKSLFLTMSIFSQQLNWFTYWKLEKLVHCQLIARKPGPWQLYGHYSDHKSPRCSDLSELVCSVLSESNEQRFYNYPFLITYHQRCPGMDELFFLGSFFRDDMNRTLILLYHDLLSCVWCHVFEMDNNCIASVAYQTLGSTLVAHTIIPSFINIYACGSQG